MWKPVDEDEAVSLMNDVRNYYATCPSRGFIEYHETSLEDALETAGVGKYQSIHCFLMVAILSTALIEITGPAYILPAAACELDIPDSLMGLLASLPNIGIVMTAHLWGRVADSWGRKPVLLLSSAVTGAFSFAAAFSMSLCSYVICKTVVALFLSCPSSLGWAYISEMLPKRRQDSTVLVCNAFLTLTSVLSPVIAWFMFAYEFRAGDGTLLIKPWRLLTATYALCTLLVVLFMARVDESPKYLMSRGRRRQALEVVKHIYSVNSGQAPERFSVTTLSFNQEQLDNSAAKIRQTSGMALFHRPHFKWLALIGFLMFGLFTVLNGLFLFAPVLINKVINSPVSVKGTICVLVDQTSNMTAMASPCSDTLSRETFVIIVSSTVVYSLIAMAASMSTIDKRIQLITMFTVVGLACLCSGLQNNRLMAAFAMSALQLPSLGIGALTAYTVHLFPTSLRGTAVGAVMMFGRLGSVVGANLTGQFLPAACTTSFYGFSLVLFLCASLSSHLPRHRNTTNVPSHT